jgi:YidC/Oxa1 family membrane protein insertase
MTDIRRTVLWVVFGMSMLLLWDAWQKHNGHPSLFSLSAPRPTASAGSAPGSTPGTVPGTSALPTATGAAAPIAEAASAPSAGEKVTLSTDLYKATFDSQGGTLVRLELLKQADADDKTQNVVLFNQQPGHVYLAQSGLVGAPALPTHLTNMAVVPGERTLKDGQDTLSLRFEAQSGGVKLAKIYTFKRGSYLIDVKHEIANLGTSPLQPQLYVQLLHDGTQRGGGGFFSGPQSYTGPAVYSEAGKFQKVDFKDIEKGKVEHQKSADDGWVAMLQHYYASAWLRNDAAPREFYTRKVDSNEYAVGMLFTLGAIAPGATQTVDTPLYAGPQQERTLAATAPGLDLVRDYGVFTVLAKPMFWLLEHLYEWIGNWGWAIVALVVLLKATFFWLNASAYRSMAKMKAINPRVMEMRERYKDKPQQMQQEMMRIYREEKVNPLGGCLPILVQIPFFIALYSVLLSSVEMRNAPWIGWIHDLSAKDPYYILPVVMTASTMLQTWLNPTPPDPVQARMMWIMPLVFSVMFFLFPAGLVLYWVTNNLLSIAQQWVINKRLGVAK